jgi:antitoxin (DNA-binding transcriptional repressor) of toxin-antitoxin stability system
MAAERLTVNEVVRNFPEILGRVRLKGEAFIILMGDKPVAELSPTKGTTRLHLGELPGILQALPHLGPEDADRFARDLETGRGSHGSG